MVITFFFIQRVTEFEPHLFSDRFLSYVQLECLKKTVFSPSFLAKRFGLQSCHGRPQNIKKIHSKLSNFATQFLKKLIFPLQLFKKSNYEGKLELGHGYSCWLMLDNQLHNQLEIALEKNGEKLNLRMKYSKKKDQERRCQKRSDKLSKISLGAKIFRVTLQRRFIKISTLIILKHFFPANFNYLETLAFFDSKIEQKILLTLPISKDLPEDRISSERTKHNFFKNREQR